MFNLKTHFKKIIALGATVITLGIIIITPARSQSLSEMYLALIAEYTYKTAEATYYAEKYIYNLLVMLNSWVLPDQSETTANLQSSFAGETNTVITNYTTQVSLQKQLMTDFLGERVKSSTVPYANDMVFGSLINQPFFDPDPRKKTNPKIDPGANYLKNISGLNIKHIPISANWAGSDEDKKKYESFYTTISAIQSYDAYVLSQLYADNVNGGTLTQQQNQLMQQASSSDWFAQVASEKNLGIIFRQMLMYNSQIYVLLTQLLQSQKQMAAELAMTNTLIVIGNEFTESQLLQKATTAQ
jgi:hypothetical protein